MGARQMLDGNEAAASVAHRVSDVIAIYPITPASPMGEVADAWSASGNRNIWGQVPEVVELQSEAGAAGTVHGALMAGALTTTFTASQGLLLMLPNMYKIAGELIPCCVHVAARTVATHALSIFCDHSDVMAARPTGWAMVASSSVQEAQDLACVCHATTLEARVPVLHFFDGFRTSHEITNVVSLSDDDLRALIPQGAVDAHRARGLSPDRPDVRGTAQNPDVFFQGREASEPFYRAFPQLFDKHLQLFGQRTGRSYRACEYWGHPEAERVIVVMGSASHTAAATARELAGRGEKVAVVSVRLYRPFPLAAFAAALPPSVARVAVLDRTKEPGATGDPLYLDVVAALAQTGRLPGIEVRAGRYGLSSKEFTPAMAAAVFDSLAGPDSPQRFTVGIQDDVNGNSLAPSSFTLPSDGTREAVFFGLGADGTVGANKNTIKIIGKATSLHAQGYFVYDSKKSGAVTVSHLRFGPEPIEAPYLIEQAQFVACHQFDLLARLDVTSRAAPGATLLLNAPHPAAELWRQLPASVRSDIVEKQLTVHTIDAYRVAREAGLGVRINTIMQACFFALSGLMPMEQALKLIKGAIRESYGKRGPVVVRQNEVAVDQALAHLQQLAVPSQREAPSAGNGAAISPEAPEFVRDVIGLLLAGHGDELAVSAMPVDGRWPSATSQYEKRNLAQEIPRWDPQVCIQCNWCTLVCPHAAIRAKVYQPEMVESAPEGFLAVPFKSPDFKGMSYTIQVAPEDCTGCHLCATVCPAKDKTNPRHKALDMVDQRPLRSAERERYGFFLELPEVDRSRINRWDAKHSQLLQPLFEYSGACAGCGETPYIKLLTQLFGDRLLIANATGCSSIYGGNLPTTPYTTNSEGRGPAWANSLFEDNAEFGLGLRLAADTRKKSAQNMLRNAAASLHIPDDLAHAILAEPLDCEASIAQQRQRIEELRQLLGSDRSRKARRLLDHLDDLVEKSVWLVGGDGWAYDIGYGGLDHVLSMGKKVNVLVLDTEVYSNTGGQQSKATPLGAAAKFAVAGKDTAKKDLGMEAMSYRGVYVAQVAMGANQNQVVAAFREADSFPGPSLIIAHSPCIAHGYDLRHGADQQRLAVATGAWPLYRYDPRRIDQGEPPLHLDCKPPSRPLTDYLRNETRFRMAERMNPARFKRLVIAAQQDAKERFAVYQQLAGITVPRAPEPEAAAKAGSAAEEE